MMKKLIILPGVAYNLVQGQQLYEFCAIVQLCVLNINNMKKQHLSEYSLQQKTAQLSKIYKNQERLTKITQKFASINKNLLERSELDRTLANQQADSLSKIAKLEQRIELTIQKCEQRFVSSKDKLKSVRESQTKIQTCFKQKLGSSKQKLKKLKTRFNSILIEEHYKHQQVLMQVQQEFQRILLKTYQNKYLFSQKIAQKNSLKIHERLAQELNELKSQSETIESQENRTMESLVSQLESKLFQLKQKLKHAQSSHQQIINDVKSKVETMKQEFQAQLGEEKATREQNKEKLLTLLETNIVNSLNKSIK